MCVRETTLKSNTRQAETRNKTSHQDNTPAQHTTQSITDPHVDYNDTKHVKQRKMKRKRHHRVKNCYNDTLCVQNMEILIVQICGFCSLWCMILKSFWAKMLCWYWSTTGSWATPANLYTRCTHAFCFTLILPKNTPKHARIIFINSILP